MNHLAENSDMHPFESNYENYLTWEFWDFRVFFMNFIRSYDCQYKIYFITEWVRKLDESWIQLSPKEKVILSNLSYKLENLMKDNVDDISDRIKDDIDEKLTWYQKDSCTEFHAGNNKIKRLVVEIKNLLKK